MAELADYIASLDAPAPTVIDAWRRRALAPDAEEGKSYGMAALRYRGRPLVSVITSKAGYTVYPFSADVVEKVLPSVTGYESTKGGIRFTDDRPLPDDAFAQLVTARRDEIDAAMAG